jgi:hypothetical protein
MLLRSNPGNPTGVTLQPSDLDKLAAWTKESNFAALIDEAYEFFAEPPMSVLAHVKNIDDHNLFVIGAATKGLQAPGARTGWVIGPARELETLKNFSSYGMGGVSQLSQNYVLQLFEQSHIDAARTAIAKFYGSQRRRYIDALKQSVLAHWKAHGRAQDAGGKLVMSFHGVPKRTLMLGDPYHCECQKTGRLLAEALGLGKDDYLITFQSRFGKAEWLQPYTAPTLHDLARRGVRRVDVMCPGFPKLLPARR